MRHTKHFTQKGRQKLDEFYMIELKDGYSFNGTNIHKIANTLDKLKNKVKTLTKVIHYKDGDEYLEMDIHAVVKAHLKKDKFKLSDNQKDFIMNKPAGFHYKRQQRYLNRRVNKSSTYVPNDYGKSELDYILSNCPEMTA